MALRFVVRPPVLLRLDDDGYRSRTRSAGGSSPAGGSTSRTSPWPTTCCVLPSTDGGEQRLPLGFVGRDRMRLLQDIHDRLNTANGYRRFEG